MNAPRRHIFTIDYKRTYCGAKFHPAEKTVSPHIMRVMIEQVHVNSLCFDCMRAVAGFMDQAAPEPPCDPDICTRCSETKVNG